MALFFKRNFCSIKSDLSSHYDFIISGGGMVGTTLACVLGKIPLLNNKSVLLIDNAPKPKMNKTFKDRTYSNRVSAVNENSKKVFQEAGMWERIESERFHPVNDIKVWGEYSKLSTNFSIAPEGEVLAYIIENDLIVEAATSEIDKLDNVTVQYSTQVQDVVLSSNDHDPAEVILQDGTKVSCSLLIGADGANSLIRKKLGFHYLSFDYNQCAIVATLHVGCDGPNNVAWQKFLRKGPVALLPLNDTMSSLVWSTSQDEAQSLLSMSEDSFVDSLNDSINAPPKTDVFVSTVQNCLQTALDVLKVSSKQKELMPPYISSIEPGSRAKFPLGFGHASHYVSHKVCLIGDAAHKVHPLAGQGVNLGFSDINTLTQILITSVRNGNALGCIRDLLKYETYTLRHNVPVMAGINLFHNLFATDLTLLKIIGNSSFLIANNVDPIKRVMRDLASN